MLLIKYKGKRVNNVTQLKSLHHLTTIMTKSKRKRKKREYGLNLANNALRVTLELNRDKIYQDMIFMNCFQKITSNSSCLSRLVDNCFRYVESNSCVHIGVRDSLSPRQLRVDAQRQLSLSEFSPISEIKKELFELSPYL